MAGRGAFSYTEVCAHLKVWKECLYALAEGQAKAYKIGTREFTAFDIDEVRRMVDYFSDLKDAYENGKRVNRGVRVVPRDI